MVTALGEPVSTCMVLTKSVDAYTSEVKAVDAAASIQAPSERRAALVAAIAAKAAMVAYVRVLWREGTVLLVLPVWGWAGLGHLPYPPLPRTAK